MRATTTMRISPENRAELYARKGVGDSLNDVIGRLIEESARGRAVAAAGKESAE